MNRLRYILLLNQIFTKHHLVSESSMVQGRVACVIYRIHIDRFWLPLEETMVAQDLSYLNSIWLVVQMSCGNKWGQTQFWLVAVDICVV